MTDHTTVQVTEGVWEHLNRQKRPGESFDDTIQRLINRSAIFAALADLGHIESVCRYDLKEDTGLRCEHTDATTGDECDRFADQYILLTAVDGSETRIHVCDDHQGIGGAIDSDAEPE